MAHHPPIAALMGEELEHIRRLHRSRVLADDSEERLQVERDRPQGVGPRPTRHELQIPIQQRMAEREAHLTRRRDGANQARDEAHRSRFPAPDEMHADATWITRVFGVPFLYGSAPLLAQSGLGRLRPATWARL
jgi:hypothetical protein